MTLAILGKVCGYNCSHISERIFKLHTGHLSPHTLCLYEQSVQSRPKCIMKFYLIAASVCLYLCVAHVDAAEV